MPKLLELCAASNFSSPKFESRPEDKLFSARGLVCLVLVELLSFRGDVPGAT